MIVAGTALRSPFNLQAYKLLLVFPSMQLSMKMSNKRPPKWTAFYERRTKVNRIVNFFQKKKKLTGTFY